LACGDNAPELTNAAACAIELMHCASLVHDDMPCFDDADTRRGQVAVHKAFGEPLALLCGDALIVQAYQCLLQTPSAHPERTLALMQLISDSVGAPDGIVAGQAWECETRVELSQYQRAKTGALFVASTCAGALANGADPQAWRGLGEALGEAYQVADDIRDVMGDAQHLGKPVGQDVHHSRPSAATALGLAGALLAAQGNFVSPALMQWHQSGVLMMMVILGGVGRLWGPVVGAVVFLLLEEILGHYTMHWQFFLGAILLAVVLLAPRGLAALGERRAR
jgi:geranylgeranyl pyrophosphate synthase